MHGMRQIEEVSWKGFVTRNFCKTDMYYISLSDLQQMLKLCELRSGITRPSGTYNQALVTSMPLTCQCIRAEWRHRFRWKQAWRMPSKSLLFPSQEVVSNPVLEKIEFGEKHWVTRWLCETNGIFRGRYVCWYEKYFICVKPKLFYLW